MSWKSSKSTISVINELENLHNEVGALQRAVESKTAANVILREELKECQRDRDKFQLIAETHPLSYPTPSSKTKISLLRPTYNQSAMLSNCEGSLAQLLSQTKEENKQLRFDIIQLRCRLHDAQSDLKVLRDERHRHCDQAKSRLSASTSSQLAQQERESLILQLEELSTRCHALEGDLRCLLEEREELIGEREDIRQKLRRLNHILNKLLQNNSQTSCFPAVDLDAIITENRYLQQRLKQVKEEKTLAVNDASKYKSALEKCRNGPRTLKLGSRENLIVTPKQVSQFLSEFHGEIDEKTEMDLKSLCLALVDSLHQKSQVVKTQKAANKMLFERLHDVEKRFHCKATIPKTMETEMDLVSETLMEGYNFATQGVTPFCEVMQESNNLLQQAKLKIPEMNEKESEKKLIREMSPSEHVEEPLDEKEEDDATAAAAASACSSSKQPSSSESEIEEVIPIEMLDSYISEVRKKQKKKRPVELREVEPEEGLLITKAEPFDLEMSDYDSDNSNLDVALQDWQSEFDKNNSPTKKKKAEKELTAAYQNL